MSDSNIPSNEENTIQDTSFVRKDFYLDPPVKGSTPEEWREWLKADANKSRAAKAAFTKSLKHEEVPEAFQESALVKVAGKWTQGHLVGMTGSVEDGSFQIEPAVEATQEKAVIVNKMEATRHKRGGSTAGKSARRRANRKNRR